MIKFTATCIIGVFFFLGNSPVLGRAMYDPNHDPGITPKIMAGAIPNLQFDVHNIGKLAMTISNQGTFGTGFLSSPICDGGECPSAEYPINSNIEYLFSGALWIGAVVGRDTLVSVGADGWYTGINELLPDPGDAGAIISRSSLKSKTNYSDDAISEQDFICTFTDTFTDPGLTGVDDFDNRPHIPLNVAVKQSSYAWSYDYSEDFILFDYQITNIGAFPIKSLYLAVYIDGDVYHKSNESSGYDDDICGFRRTVAMPPGYGITEDTVNIAWIADNDGDPTTDGSWAYTSPVGVTGTRVVRTPNDSLQYAFNWWISNGNAAQDFGPRLAGSDTDPFYSFGTHLGTPTGDKNKYYIMSHNEFDYDQLFTAVNHESEGYLPPPKPEQARTFADGYDTRYLLSFGPFDVDPGDTLPVTLAYLAGDDFHVDPDDFKDYFDPFTPEVFYSKLSFDDFGTNARWASWVYDNPGVDSDGPDIDLDGDPTNDSGKFNWVYTWTDTTATDPSDSFIVDSEKVYYAGDGIPDFRGASPPPPPEIKVYPSFASVTLRWNGQESENAIDVFSRQQDFEGYRVYLSRGERLSDYVLLTSFDLNDYKVYEFNEVLLTWDQYETPLTLDSLRQMYGPAFDPSVYDDPTRYFTDPRNNALLYFRAQDWNESDVTDPLGIHKVYPEASKTDSTDTNDEGLLRYYDYEYTIPNLQPSVPYYFSVTAFDYGSLNVDLGALESSPLVNAVMDYPLPSGDEVEDQALEVLVYPNPYRIDGNYADFGYENRDRTRSAERSRAIHFANLPNICTIRIYTLNGDLVRELEHNYPNGGPGSQHETWDVISRNTQAVVTGIYLWHVESDMGDQIGKLVIMK